MKGRSRQRTLLAIQLLRSSALLLNEVARRAGFHGQSHLSRHFKHHYGLLPEQFIQLHLHVHVGT